jgi:hypothetical protein
MVKDSCVLAAAFHLDAENVVIINV